VRLHDRGLVRRALRPVNWSCDLRSAISNIEVESESVSGRTSLRVPGYSQPVEFGVLHHIAFPVVDAAGVPVHGAAPLVVATTRPETLPADIAVALHPANPRLAHAVWARNRIDIIVGF
jgi:valyl-tRNA synthetase